MNATLVGPVNQRVGCPQVSGALRMADQAGARYLVPVHHQTFKLSDEPMTEPMERMSVAVRRETDRLAVKRIGESFCVA